MQAPPQQSQTQTPYVSSKTEARLPALTDAFSLLTCPHFFSRYNEAGFSARHSVYFTENLSRLLLEASDGSLTTLNSADLIEAKLGSSAHRVLAANSFHLVSRHRTIDLSASSHHEMESWVSTVNELIRVTQHWLNNRKLVTYCGTKAETEDYCSQLNTITSQQAECRETTYRLKKATEQATAATAHVMSGSLANQAQLEQLHTKAKQLEREVSRLNTETEALEACITESQELLSEKREEVGVLTETLQNLHSRLMYFELLERSSRPSERRTVWGHVIEYLQFADLLALQRTCRSHHRLVSKHLLVKANWQTLALGALQPRLVSWPRFLTTFYSGPVQTEGAELPDALLSAIRADVAGLSNQTQLEVSVINLFVLRPDLVYSSSVVLVMSQLLKHIRNTFEAVKAALVLMRPPFFIGDLWSADQSRLHIGLFQLKFLMKLKLPELAKHFKAKNIELGHVVSPWFLSCFAHQVEHQHVPSAVTEHIWDCFLVSGWPVLISAALGWLAACQSAVLGQSAEKTLDCLTGNLPHRDFHLAKYKVEAGMLDELERTFYLQ